MYSGVLAAQLEPEVRRLLDERAAQEGPPSTVSTRLGGDSFTLFASARLEIGDGHEARLVVSAGASNNDLAIFVAAHHDGRTVPPDHERQNSAPDLAVRVATALSTRVGGGEVRQEDETAWFPVPLVGRTSEPTP